MNLNNPVSAQKPSFPPTTHKAKADSAYWLLFSEHYVLVNEGESPTFPQWHTVPSAFPLEAVEELGTWQGLPCYAAALSRSITAPPGMVFQHLRSLMRLCSEAEFRLAGQAYQVLLWERNHRFCGHCGTALQTSTSERVRRCPQCKLEHYPRIAPAVIMRIAEGKKLLLSRSAHFPPGMRSVQAGFVEPGETLEQAVQREVMEEVGLKIKNIRYFGSQSWPFPSSLMMAFTADYASGSLRVNYAELEDAAWYDANQLPPLPPERSIAYRLIQDWLALSR